MTIAHYSSSCAYSLLHACTWAEGEHRPPVALEGKVWSKPDVPLRRGKGIRSGRRFDQ